MKEDLKLRFSLLINEMNSDQRWLALQQLVARCNADADRELLARGWRVSITTTPAVPRPEPPDDSARDRDQSR